MATSNQALLRDNSTLTNFKQWAKAISDFFITAGWTRSSDSGMVNWSSIASVPAHDTYVYEIFQPADGLTTFYLKVEYGTGTSSTNTNPRIRLSIGTSTSGAGTLTGFVTSLQTNPNPANDVTVSSTVTQLQCYFSGDTGRIGVIMWRDDTANPGPIFFGVQRSLNSSGSPTSDYVTLVSAGNAGGGNQPCWQQSVSFTDGVSNGVAAAVSNQGQFICLKRPGASSDIFAGKVPLSPVFPDVGFFPNPMDIVAVGCISDFTEGAQYPIASGNMPYGVSRNYIAAKNQPFQAVGQSSVTNSCLLMRYD